MRTYYDRSLIILRKLKQTIPEISLGKHLSTALDESVIENLTDKMLFNRLNDYLSELESDVMHTEDIEQIIKEGMDLEHILDNEE